MIDPRELLEEYVDGILDASQRREMDDALARDAELRSELDRVRRFGSMLDGLPTSLHTGRVLSASTRRGKLLFPIFAVAAAAALLLWITGPGFSGEGSRDDWPRDEPMDDAVIADIRSDWTNFGRRLAQITQERRDGRVPRQGLGDLEVPPAKAFGIVYAAGLDELGVELDGIVRSRAQELVQAHFVVLRNLPSGIEGEYQRSEKSLELYRNLRNEAGRDAADAYYELFRPGLVDRDTVIRLESGSLERVLRDRTAYVAAYDSVLRRMARRYGAETVAFVMDRIAPEDSRNYRRDATQDGANPDAVLSIRTELYRAAVESGSEHVYIDVG